MFKIVGLLLSAFMSYQAFAEPSYSCKLASPRKDFYFELNLNETTGIGAVRSASGRAVVRDEDGPRKLGSVFFSKDEVVQYWSTGAVENGDLGVKLYLERQSQINPQAVDSVSIRFFTKFNSVTEKFEGTGLAQYNWYAAASSENPEGGTGWNTEISIECSEK